jgi:predicted metalloprotease with PDZ domain
MRQMWQQFGKQEIGFTPKQLQETIEAIAGIDLNDFFNRYIDGLEDLPFNTYLEPFGLRLKSVLEDDPAPYLGMRVLAENGKQSIKFVEANSPAGLAGIDADDELLAIDGLRVSAEQLNERLKDYRVGDIIQVTVFHQDELRTLAVKLASPQPNRYEIVRIENPSEIQKQNLTGWLQKV